MNTSEIPPGTDTLSVDPDRIAPRQIEERFILAQLEGFTLVFPSTVVEEISIFERSQILPLPFYDTTVLGVIHHRGAIVPLVSLRQIIGVTAGLKGETLTVVRLSKATENLAGLGLAVDTILGSKSKEELPPDIFSAAPLPDLPQTKMLLFRCDLLGDRLWQPHRWGTFAKTGDLRV